MLADRFDPKAALMLVRRHVPLLAACTAVGLCAGFAYDRTQVRTYTATAKLEVAPAGARVLADVELESGGESTLRLVSTAKERVRSRVLAERVASELDVDAEARLLAKGRAPSNATASEETSARSLADLLEQSQDRRLRKAASALSSGLTVGMVRNTNLLNVRFTHQDSEVAALVANAFTKSYVAMERERLLAAAHNTQGFIEKQVASAEQELRRSEAELVRFVTDAKLAVGANGEPAVETGIASLRNALADATIKRIIAERRLEQMDRDGPATLPAALDHDGVQRARIKAAGLRAEYRERRARMKPDFPLMRSIENRIAGFERDIDRELVLLAESVRAEVRQARDREASLRGEIAAAEASILDAKGAAVGYSALKRRVDADRARYARLAGKLSEVAVSAALVEPRVRVLEQASVPRSPSNGNLLLHLLGGLVIFFGLGGAVATVREILRDEFDSPADFTAETDVPVIGTVPKIRFGRLGRADANADSGLREAYRYIRAAVMAGPLAEPGRVLLVAGIGRDAGASFTARRLALDLASLDRRVLLVDADFRTGNQHDALGTGNAAGLSDLLAGSRAPVAECFAKVPGTSLTLLPSGPSIAESSDRLASPRMGRMLALLRKSFDVVILDAAPVLSRADASTLAGHADSTLVVARDDKTRRSEAQAAMLHLREARADIAGAVYTRYERRSFQRVVAQQVRSPFETLRDLVPAMEGTNAPNPVHEMLGRASAAMRRHAA